MIDPERTANIQAITRPDRGLLTYYVLGALAFPPAFPFVILPMYFRYHTMRYKFTDDGISMSWGILFRRETIVNYSRIQDIHLRSNFVERWLGLARILVQTASGSASAEMTIEGVKDVEGLRDFLYSRMRGVHDHHPSPPDSSPSLSPLAASGTSLGEDELVSALREAALELRAVREALQNRESRTSESN